MNASIRCKADVNQWRSTKEVIRWVQQLRNKKQLSYLTFNIVDFYTSITDNLLIRTLNWAQKYHNITVMEFETIMHARRTILCDHKGNAWIKKYLKKNSSTCQWELMMVQRLWTHRVVHTYWNPQKHRFHMRRPRRRTSSETICIWKLLGKT